MVIFDKLQNKKIEPTEVNPENGVTYSDSIKVMLDTAIAIHDNHWKTKQGSVWLTCTAESESIKAKLIEKGVDAKDIFTFSDRDELSNKLNPNVIDGGGFLGKAIINFLTSGQGSDIPDVASFRVIAIFLNLHDWRRGSDYAFLELTEALAYLNKNKKTVSQHYMQILLPSLTYEQISGETEPDEEACLSWTNISNSIKKEYDAIQSLFSDDGVNLSDKPNGHYIFSFDDPVKLEVLTEVVYEHYCGNNKLSTIEIDLTKNTEKPPIFFEQSHAQNPRAVECKGFIASGFYSQNIFCLPDASDSAYKEAVCSILLASESSKTLVIGEDSETNTSIIMAKLIEMNGFTNLFDTAKRR